MAQTILLTLINVKIDKDESLKPSPRFLICNESFSNENTSMEVHQIFLSAKHIRFMYYFGHARHSFDNLGLGDPVASSRSGIAAERKQSYAMTGVKSRLPLGSGSLLTITTELPILLSCFTQFVISISVTKLSADSIAR